MLNWRLVIALVFVAACHKSEPSDDTAAISHAPAPLEIDSVGNAPLRPLRYHLTAGTKAALELAMDLDLEGGGTSNKLPTLVMQLSVEVASVEPDGDARVSTTIAGAHVLDRDGATVPATTVAQTAELVRGLTYTTTVAPDGSRRDTQITARPAASTDQQLAQLTEAIELATSAMPAVPVGVGAKWTTRKHSRRDDIAFTTVTVTEITAIDGDHVTIQSDSSIAAPDQTFEQDGVRAKISDIGGGGHTKATIDLTTTTMKGEVTMELRGTMTAGGETSPLTTAMKLTTK